MLSIPIATANWNAVGQKWLVPLGGGFGKVLGDRHHTDWTVVSRTNMSLLRFLVCSACLFLSFTEVRAQDISASRVHWAYSSYFGTGWYQVDGDRDVYVLRMTPRKELRESDLADDGKRTIGIELKFPITAGLEVFTLNDIPGTLDPDNLASLSVTPGIDITVPLNERWTLRPFASIGYGALLNGSESAWTYWAGVKSRYAFQSGNLNWALINSLLALRKRTPRSSCMRLAVVCWSCSERSIARYSRNSVAGSRAASAMARPSSVGSLVGVRLGDSAPRAATESP